MIRRLVASRRGTAAIEFALVAPIFLVACLAACAFGLLAWKWSALETVAASTARCIAIASVECESAQRGCASDDLEICYALRLAEEVGVSELRPHEIEVHRETGAAGMRVVRVDLRHEASLVGYSLPLEASASFPIP